MSDIKLSEKEVKLITELRKIQFGQVIIFIEGGQPVRIEKVKESIKL